MSSMQPKSDHDSAPDDSRRGFLKGAVVAAGAGMAGLPQRSIAAVMASRPAVKAFISSTVAS